MVRANIKNADGVYIGLIDEESGWFRIVWNRNVYQYPEYDWTNSARLFATFEDACQGVRNAARDAIISETIYYRPR